MRMSCSDSSERNIASSLADSSGSDIGDFFKDTNVFITGGTGFLGNVLLEKLLRCCPGINKIYLLVRPKLGKDTTTRVEEIFKGPIFKAMKAEAPDYAKKVALISGDLEAPECGICEEDKELLRRQINVVFHAAATVRFDAELSTAIKINVRATRDLLEMACQMENLKAFVYVSTAFTNCLRGVIHERIYDPPITGDSAIRMLGEDKNLITELTSRLKETWPNTYVFTKCIAENFVQELGKNMPIAVVRPAIVVSTARAPICGWTNSCNGPTGCIAGIMLGVSRTFQVDLSRAAEVVPVDYVINAIIASAWEIGTSFVSEQASLTNGLTNAENHFMADGTGLTCSSGLSLQDSCAQTRHDKRDSVIPVYNFVSSNKNKITWRSFLERSKDAIADAPSTSAVWCGLFIPRKNRLEYLICNFFLHFLPALLGDVWLRAIGEKPRFVKISRKMDKMSTLLWFFCSKQWNFKSENVSRLWGKLNTNDKETFYFDLKSLDWKDYFHHYVRGIREYVLQEPNDTIPQARRKRFRLLVVHYALVSIFFLLFAYVVFLISPSLRPYLNLSNLKYTIRFASNSGYGER